MPFFYGWVIWGVSTLGYLMSVPGQTMGMAVFTDTFIETLALSRSELSFAYLCGTVGSAFFLTRAGRLYDRIGARIMVTGAAVLLGVLVLFVSLVDRLGALLAAYLGVTLSTVTLPLIVLGYFGVRFAGQGVLTSASHNVLLVWFERRRALVTGVRGVFVSLGFSLAPLLLAGLIAALGWRAALWAIAATLLGGFALLALVLLRDSPASAGLAIDGRPAPRSDDVGEDGEDGADDGSYTLAEARRSRAFWMVTLGLAIHALFGTAMTFHVVAIFGAAGRSADEAFAYFLPQAAVATATNLTISAWADRHRLKPILIIMLSAFLTAGAGLLLLAQPVGYGLLVAGFGIGGGCWGVLMNNAYIRYFGARHLGEISGLKTAINVFASALGPLLFSLGLDWGGSFAAPVIACEGAIALLLVAAVLIAQPEDQAPGAVARAHR